MLINQPAWVVVDVETTGLTPYSEPLKPPKKLPPHWDGTPRLRLVTVLRAGAAEPEVYDLDNMTAFHCSILARDILSTPRIIGHNVGFDLAWLRHIAGPDAPMPADVIDTMLLARLLRPDIPVRLALLAARKPTNMDDLALVERARELVQRRASWSLEVLALVMLGRLLAKGFQEPGYWAGELSPAHLAYARQDVLTTAEIATHLLGPDLAAPVTHPVWPLLARQVQDVVRIRENGVPWDAAAAAEYRREKLQVAITAAYRLAEDFPELHPHRDTLADPERGDTAALRATISDILTRLGQPVPRTEAGAVSISADALIECGLTDGGNPARPLVTGLLAVKEAKKRAMMATEYTGYAGRARDGRIHPLLGHGPVTGRLSSAEPNVQNLPRDDAFRALVRVPPGQRVIAADFSMIELRIAAALAIRAQQQALTRPWAAEILAGKRITPEEVAAARGEAQWWEAHSPRQWEKLRRAQRRAMITEAWYVFGQLADRGPLPTSVMRDVFVAGGDVHLYTGLALLGRNPAEALCPERAADLKKDPAVKAARQRAKALNFGLLYGLGSGGLRRYAKVSYGVDMTPEEAVKARETWLAQYPEIHFWQLFTWLACASEDEVWYWHPFRASGGGVRKGPMYTVTTLAGRSFVVLEPRKALNFQDQGTGADITMLAVRRLMEAGLGRFVVNQIHDEILCVAPDAEAEHVAAELVRCMREAAEEVLSPFGVPVAVDVVRGKNGELPRCWMKD